VLKNEKKERVLVNTVSGRPLLVRRGCDFVESFLRKINETTVTDTLLELYPAQRNLLEMLWRHGVIVDGEASEEIAAPSLEPRRRSAMSLYLLVAQGCTLDCIYCSAGRESFAKARRPIMANDVAQMAVERCLQSLDPDGRLQVVFFGGEPLLNWPVVKHTIDYWENELRHRYRDRRIHFHLTTNLTQFPSDLIERAKNHDITFLVDIDGPAHLHDTLRPFCGGSPSHARIIKNIHRLRGSGIKFELRTTVTRHNVEHLVEIAAHHKELGSQGTAFVPVTPINSDEVILPSDWYPDPEVFAAGLKAVYESGLFPPSSVFPINQYMKKIDAEGAHCISCGAPFLNTPNVTVDGDVYPCSYWTGIERFKVGNIRDPRVFENASSLSADLLRRIHIDDDPSCRVCELKYICGGGCPVNRVSLRTHPKCSEESCRYGKEIVCRPFKSMMSMLIWEAARRQTEAVVGWTAHLNGEGTAGSQLPC
jgi:uncharacterized protein